MTRKKDVSQSPGRGRFVACKHSEGLLPVLPDQCQSSLRAFRVRSRLAKARSVLQMTRTVLARTAVCSCGSTVGRADIEAGAHAVGKGPEYLAR